MSGLEISGAALAVPGLIDVIVRGGEVLYKKIETFKNVDKAVSSYRELALDIKEGPLFFGLDLLKSLSKDRVVPAALKDRLDKSLAKVESELKSSLQALDEIHEDTVRGKLAYTLWRGKGSQHQLLKFASSLKEACDRLKDLCLQLHNYKTSTSSYLWTSDVLKLRHETMENRPGDRLPLSDIVIAKGNYVSAKGRVEADFILETKGQENDVKFLCSVLNETALAGRKGILPVLGYRQPPYHEIDGTTTFELIVELPRNTTIESLAQHISSNPQPDMALRLRICLSIAEALANVHSVGLLHKSLRPRAILTPAHVATQDKDFIVYLQDWTYIREVCGATTQLGEDSWQKALYQHPERQGKYAEAVYQPKHDIYSLGVSLLEILSWKTFIVPGPTHLVESGRVCDLFENTGIALGEANGGLPERYRGDAVKLTSRPLATRTIWCEVTRLQLNDDDIRELVLGCLDGNFDTVEEAVRDIQKAIATRV